MGSRTRIQWTDATWSPVSGCSHVSPGCEHCYAEAMARRFDKEWKPWTAANAAHNVRMNLYPTLEDPLHWRKPKKVFLCSMGDLFHEQVSTAYIDRVFAVMAAAPQHTFQVLTKRPERMRSYVGTARERSRQIAKMIGVKVQTDPFWISADLWEWPLPNVWLGVTLENQRAEERISHLLQTPAAVKFVSCEPLLGPIDFSDEPTDAMSTMGPWSYLDELDWVIVGGESGPNARPMNPKWVRSIRDQCQWASVPFFFKQWGEWAPNCLCKGRTHQTTKRPPPCSPLSIMFRCGKKAAGRKLDGRTWDEIP